MKIRLDEIQTEGTQSRAQLDQMAVDEYTTAMREGDIFPAIIVFGSGDGYWLADGFHRVKAAMAAGLDSLEADIQEGGRRDAILYSVGANSSHGVRRTNRDKRRSVELLLADEEWVQWADREIARRCGVSDRFVNKMREDLSANRSQIDPPNTRKTVRNGTVYEMKIPQKPEPIPEPEPEEEVTLYEEPEEEYEEEWEPEPEEEQAEPIAEIAELFEEPETPKTNVVILNRDACYLAEYVTEPVHLVVTSPPYNVGIDYSHHADALSTYFDLISTVWRECYQVMADGARIAVVVPFGVGRNPWVPFASRVADTLVEAGFTLRGQIIWDKNTSGNRTSWGSFRMSSDPSLRDTTEAIIVAHKGSQNLKLPDTVKFRDEKGTYTEALVSSEYFMELAQDHWIVSPESAQRIGHPAPFPVELVKRLIDFYAFPGAHILDPFGGSGTTGVAAVRCGCDATLFDVDAEYCQMAEGRIKNG